METMQGGELRGGNDPLGGTARWPHAPGGLPSAYDQDFHRADDEEPVLPQLLALRVHVFDRLRPRLLDHSLCGRV